MARKHYSGGGDGSTAAISSSDRARSGIALAVKINHVLAVLCLLGVGLAVIVGLIVGIGGGGMGGGWFGVLLGVAYGALLAIAPALLYALTFIVDGFLHAALVVVEGMGHIETNGSLLVALNRHMQAMRTDGGKS